MNPQDSGVAQLAVRRCHVTFVGSERSVAGGRVGAGGRPPLGVTLVYDRHPFTASEGVPARSAAVRADPDLDSPKSGDTERPSAVHRLDSRPEYHFWPSG
ncbi:MAG: hypothetical protein ACXW4T_02895, partial [Candidatus Limnocylindrales bacterium]